MKKPLALVMLGLLAGVCLAEGANEPDKNAEKSSAKPAEGPTSTVTAEKPVTIEPLIARLKDKDPGVRRDAALALGKLGDARAVEALSASLKDEDENVRKAAAEALALVELKPFIEKGTRLLQTASADLDGDGTTDYILVLEKQKEKPDDPDITEGQRPLLILIRDATGTLNLVKRNDKIIRCSTCGGMGPDPFAGIEAGVKTFTVNHEGGTSLHWLTEYKFNYSRIDRTWQLVGVKEADTDVLDPNSETKVKVYTPPKDYGKIDFADFDPDNYLGKGER